MSEAYWFDGQPFAGIEPDAPAPETPNTELYWIDGASASDLLLLADTIPYVPPYVPPAPSPSPWGSETYWVDGNPSQGLVDDPEIINTSTELYWLDGASDGDTFPTADVNPWVPPYVPPDPDFSPWGEEKYWVNGEPSRGLTGDLDLYNTNDETFWVNGHTANAAFPTPYHPPAAYSSYYGNETFWISGYPAEGLKTTSLMTTGSESYWINGGAEKYLFKLDNTTTGKFFLLFE